MDEWKKRALLEQGLARMARNLGRHGLSPFACESWSVPTDIYETEQAFVVYMELAGVDPAAIQVVAEETRLTISGERNYQLPPQVRRVHQLEIERGYFEKQISLPRPIDVAAAETEHRHGFLVIILPKQRRRISVPISSG
ncbi:Hsp20/alpha crystallin family protein [Desulfurivibrio sp. C05AmB]|uniref:Hsp20/alpha crystallin family protein n=1 Tax=Desulfurivibrio sp. C05AmB TaxID=3374371 RepID=UPI00376EF95B